MAKHMGFYDFEAYKNLVVNVFVTFVAYKKAKYIGFGDFEAYKNPVVKMFWTFEAFKIAKYIVVVYFEAFKSRIINIAEYTIKKNTPTSSWIRNWGVISSSKNISNRKQPR